MKEKPPVNGRRKGSGFERELCKQFSKWSGLTIDRTFMSGGGAQKGDIAPAHNDWPFCVEAKNRESWSLEDLFQRKGEIQKWWKKVCAEAKAVGKIPLLIAKRNRQPPVVITLKTTRVAPYIRTSDYHVVELSRFLLVPYQDMIKFLS